MKTLTRTTRVEQIRKSDLTQKQKVCELLQWSEEMYFNFMFQQYEDFVNRMFNGYPLPMINEVKHSSIFRGFWNNEVSARNGSDFLPFAIIETEDYYEVNENGTLLVTPSLPLGDIYLIDEFMLIHNPKRLMHDDDFMHRFNKTLTLIANANGNK